MSVEIGHFALILALFAALAQSTLPLIGVHAGRPSLMATGRTAAVAQALLIAIAFVALVDAFVVSDFSVALVHQHSHASKPLLYRITGTWGNHEGSLLLWVGILALFGLMLALFGGAMRAEFRARVLAVQGWIGLGFLAFMLFTSNPFARLVPAPLEGQDLNPLLQDPGLAFHPPLLYFGYVGFSMTFSFAIAALLEGRVDAAWGRWVRPWTLAAWSGLTLGIALGSWWAYYELGWGGWWFWDPVENASLMPWITGTALIHCVIVVERRSALRQWALLLSILTFGLSLIGTFLVRSGILNSVHAFAQDSQRGLFILLLLALAIGGGFALFAARAGRLEAGGLFAPISREGALVINNLLLCTMAGTILVGTLYPMALEMLNGARVTVGPPFFNQAVMPLVLPLVAMMGVGPLLAWKRGDLPGAATRLSAAALLTGLAILLVLWLAGYEGLFPLIGMGMAVWIGLATLTDLADRIRLFALPLPRSLRRLVGLPGRSWALTLGHLGFGIALAGMAGSAGWMSDEIVLLAPGDRVEIGGRQVRFDGVGTVEGSNYIADRGVFTVLGADGSEHPLASERRWYPFAGSHTTEAAIGTSWLDDIYVVLGDPDTTGESWAVQLYHHPLVPWIWIGAAIMAMGGVIGIAALGVRRAGRPRLPLAPASAPAPAEPS